MEENDFDAFVWRRTGDRAYIKAIKDDPPPGLRFAALVISGEYRAFEVRSSSSAEQLDDALIGVLSAEGAYLSDASTSLVNEPHQDGSDGVVSGSQLEPRVRIHMSPPRRFEAYIQLQTRSGKLVEVYNNLDDHFGDCLMGVNITSGTYNILVNVGDDTSRGRDACVLKVSSLLGISAHRESLTPELTDETSYWRSITDL